MFTWFAVAPAEKFGTELATFLLEELTGIAGKRDGSFAGKAAKVLVRAGQRVDAFKEAERINFYKKAKAANAFLWTLRDGGCPEDYANELTQWLSRRL